MKWHIWALHTFVSNENHHRFVGRNVYPCYRCLKVCNMDLILKLNGTLGTPYLPQIKTTTNLLAEMYPCKQCLKICNMNLILKLNGTLGSPYLALKWKQPQICWRKCILVNSVLKVCNMNLILKWNDALGTPYFVSN